MDKDKELETVLTAMKHFFYIAMESHEEYENAAQENKAEVFLSWFNEFNRAKEMWLNRDTGIQPPISDWGHRIAIEIALMALQSQLRTARMKS